MGDAEYNAKFENLQRYIPFLDNMIQQLKDPSKKNREAQLSKMESLHAMITDRRRRLKFETLVKCEEVIIKLHQKVKGAPLGPNNVNAEKIERPIIDIYTSAGESLQQRKCQETPPPNRLERNYLSRPPISYEDLETLQADVKELEKNMSLNDLNKLRSRLCEQLCIGSSGGNLKTSPGESLRPEENINTTVRNKPVLARIMPTSPDKKIKAIATKADAGETPAVKSQVKIVKDSGAFGSALCSIDEKILEVGKRRLSAKEERVSGKEERPSTKEEQVSSKEDRFSSKEERVFTKEERLASTEERLSSKDERFSSKEERLFSKEERLPFKEESELKNKKLGDQFEAKPKVEGIPEAMELPDATKPSPVTVQQPEAAPEVLKPPDPPGVTKQPDVKPNEIVKTNERETKASKDVKNAIKTGKDVVKKDDKSERVTKHEGKSKSDVKEKEGKVKSKEMKIEDKSKETKHKEGESTKTKSEKASKSESKSKENESAKTKSDKESKSKDTKHRDKSKYREKDKERKHKESSSGASSDAKEKKEHKEKKHKSDRDKDKSSSSHSKKESKTEKHKHSSDSKRDKKDNIGEVKINKDAKKKNDSKTAEEKPKQPSLSDSNTTQRPTSDPIAMQDPTSNSIGTQGSTSDSNATQRPTCDSNAMQRPTSDSIATQSTTSDSTTKGQQPVRLAHKYNPKPKKPQVDVIGEVDKSVAESIEQSIMTSPVKIPFLEETKSNIPISKDRPSSPKPVPPPPRPPIELSLGHELVPFSQQLFDQPQKPAPVVQNRQLVEHHRQSIEELRSPTEQHRSPIDPYRQLVEKHRQSLEPHRQPFDQHQLPNLNRRGLLGASPKFMSPVEDFSSRPNSDLPTPLNQLLSHVASGGTLFQNQTADQRSFQSNVFNVTTINVQNPSETPTDPFVNQTQPNYNQYYRNPNEKLTYPRKAFGNYNFTNAGELQNQNYKEYSNFDTPQSPPALDFEPPPSPRVEFAHPRPNIYESASLSLYSKQANTYDNQLLSPTYPQLMPPEDNFRQQRQNFNQMPGFQSHIPDPTALALRQNYPAKNDPRLAGYNHARRELMNAAEMGYTRRDPEAYLRREPLLNNQEMFTRREGLLPLPDAYHRYQREDPRLARGGPRQTVSAISYKEHRERMRKEQEQREREQRERELREREQRERELRERDRETARRDPRLDRSRADRDASTSVFDKYYSGNDEGAFTSPLNSLYGTSSEKTGRGYGAQTFKIPKKKPDVENARKDDKSKEEPGEKAKAAINKAESFNNAKAEAETNRKVEGETVSNKPDEESNEEETKQTLEEDTIKEEVKKTCEETKKEDTRDVGPKKKRKKKVNKKEETQEESESEFNDKSEVGEEEEEISGKRTLRGSRKAKTTKKTGKITPVKSKPVPTRTSARRRRLILDESSDEVSDKAPEDLDASPEESPGDIPGSPPAQPENKTSEAIEGPKRATEDKQSAEDAPNEKLSSDAPSLDVQPPTDNQIKNDHAAQEPTIDTTTSEAAEPKNEADQPPKTTEPDKPAKEEPSSSSDNMVLLKFFAELASHSDKPKNKAVLETLVKGIKSGFGIDELTTVAKVLQATCADDDEEDEKPKAAEEKSTEEKVDAQADEKVETPPVPETEQSGEIPPNEVTMSVGERTKSRKRNTTPEKTNVKSRKKKSKTELDMLHEDLKDMFIRDGVITASGKRMCRILKDNQVTLAEEATPKDEDKAIVEKSKERKKPGPKKKMLMGQMDLKKMSSVKVVLPKMRDGDPRYSLRRTDSTENAADRSKPAEDDKSESSLEEEVEEEEEETAEDKDKKITRRRKRWATGVIKKIKKKPLKKVKLKLSLAQNKPQTETAPAHDKNYYLDNAVWKLKCKLCDTATRFVALHYKSQHPDSEVLSSRLSPGRGKLAINDSLEKEHTFSDVKASHKSKRHYQCRVCDYKIMGAARCFYDHVTQHTGEYRYKCPLCDFSRANAKIIRKHYLSEHKDAAVENLTYSQVNVNFRNVYAYLCSECNYFQLNKENVENHFKVYHKDSRKKIYKIDMNTCEDQETTSESTGENSNSQAEDGASEILSSLNEAPNANDSDFLSFSETASTASTAADSEVSILSASPPKAKRGRKKGTVLRKTRNSQTLEELEVTPRQSRQAKVKAMERIEATSAVTVKEKEPEESEDKTQKRPKSAKKSEEEDIAKTQNAENNETTATPDIAETDKAAEIAVEPEAPPVLVTIKKEKEVAMNVFTCETDLVEENAKIEMERLQKMEEINKNFKARHSLEFVDRLSDRLKNNECELVQKIKEEPMELDLPPPIVQVFDKSNKPPVLEPETNWRPTEVSKTEIKSKSNQKICGMIEKLQGMLGSEDKTIDDDGPPPLTHVNCSDDPRTSKLNLGPIRLLRNADGLMYSCSIPPCTFSAKEESSFSMHCTFAHPWGEEKYKSCLECNAAIQPAPKCSIMLAFLNHAKQAHSDFIKFEAVDCKKEGSKMKELKTGPITVEKINDELTYKCMLSECNLTTKNKEDFTNHCQFYHDWDVNSDTYKQCNECTFQVEYDINTPLMTSFWNHIWKDHEEFFGKKCIVGSIRVSNNLFPAAMIEKEEGARETREPEPASEAVIETPDIEESSDNPFSFKIAQVMSLAENEPPPLSPIKNTNQDARLIPPPPSKSEEALKKFIKNPQELYKCPDFHCLFSTSNKNMFNIHLKMHPIRSMTCVYCGENLPTNVLTTHYEIAHGGMCKFACAYCLYRSQSQVYVDAHQIFEHKGLPPQVVVIYQKEERYKHINCQFSKPITDLTSYRCCNKRFFFSSDLFLHIRNESHTQLKCKYIDGVKECGVELDALDVLNVTSHWANVHGICRFHCGYCSYGSDALKNMMKHEIVRHPCDPSHILDRAVKPVCLKGVPLTNVSQLKGVACNYVKYVNNLNSENQKGEDSNASLTSTETTETEKTQSVTSVPVLTVAQIPAVSSTTSTTSVVLKPTFINYVSGAPTFSVAQALTTQMSPIQLKLVPSPPKIKKILLQAKPDVPASSSASRKILTKGDEKFQIIKSPPIQQQLKTTKVQRSVLKVKWGMSPASDAKTGAPSAGELPSETPTSDADNREVESTNLPGCDEPLIRFVSQHGKVGAVDPLSLEDASTKEANKEGAEPTTPTPPLEYDSDSKDQSGSAMFMMKKVGLKSYQLFRCAACNSNFGVSELLKEHLEKSTSCKGSNAVKPYQCPHCSRLLKNINSLIDHLSYHGMLRFSCSLCNYKYPHASQARTHMKTHHNVATVTVIPVDPNKNNLYCDYFVVKPKIYEPKEPVKEQPPQEDPETPTPKAASAKTVYMPSEMDQLPIKSIFPYEITCGECKTFKNKVRTNIMRHFQLHLNENPVPDTAPVNPVPCLEKNEKMFDKMNNHAISSIVNTTRMGGVVPKADPDTKDTKDDIPAFVPSTRRYACFSKGCNYLCPEEGNLRHHMLALHASENDFVCQHCKWELPNADVDVLIKHHKLHDLHLYKCSACNFVHNLKHKVDRHITDKHGDRRAVEVETVRAMDCEPYSGEHLPPQLSSSAIMGKMAKPWKCAMCKFKAEQEEVIVAHVLNKHDIDKRYKCAFCTYKSDENSTIREHFESEHAGLPVDIIQAYHKLEEEAKPDVESDIFDTTPLWQRDRPRVRHIRGILFDDSSPAKAKKSPQKQEGASGDNAKRINRKRSSSSNVEADAPPAKLQIISKEASKKDDHFQEEEIIVICDDEDTNEILDVEHNLENVDVANEMTENAKLEELLREKEVDLICLFGDCGLPGSRQFKCPKCANFKTRNLRDFTFHMFRELKYYRYKCKVCYERYVSYKFIMSHLENVHRGWKEDMVLNLPSDEMIIAWVQMVVEKQAKILSELGFPIDNIPNVSTLSDKAEAIENYNVERAANKTDTDPLEIMSSLKWTCDECDKLFDSKLEVETHKMVAHDLPAFPSPIRDPLEDSPPAKKKKKTHGLQIYYQCKRCPFFSPFLNTFKSHWYCEHEGYEIEYEKFRKNKLGEITTENPPNLSTVPVPSTSLTPPPPPSLTPAPPPLTPAPQAVKHNRKALADKQDYFRCGSCPLEGTEAGLKEHHAASHPKSKFCIYKYTCAECNSKFKYIRGFKNHFHVHKDVSPVAYFNLNNEKIELEVQIDNVKTFKCTKCSYTSTTSRSCNIKQHIRVHAKAIECCLCKDRFKTRGEAKAHHEKEHPHNVEMIEELPEVVKELEEMFAEILKNAVVQSSIKQPPVETPAAPSGTANVARKSTGAVHKQPIQPEYSFYGTFPEEVDLSKITTKLEIGGVEMPMSCQQLCNIYNLFPRVVVEDCRNDFFNIDDSAL